MDTTLRTVVLPLALLAAAPRARAEGPEASSPLTGTAPAASPAPVAAAVPEGPSAPRLPRLLRLEDGGEIRGDLIAEVRGSHVLLRLPDGEIRRYEWAAISALVALSPKATAGPYDVAATFVGDRPFRLFARERALGGRPAGPFWPLCRLPCSQTLSRERDLRVEGEGAPATEFHLPPQGDAFQVEVRAGRGGRGATIALLAVGGGTAAAGAVTGFVDLFAQILSVIFSGRWAPVEKDPAAQAAISLVSIGAPLAILGACLLPGAGTRVRVTRRGPDGASREALRRTPRLTPFGLVF